jgi:hypothetical protein
LGHFGNLKKPIGKLREFDGNTMITFWKPFGNTLGTPKTIYKSTLEPSPIISLNWL